MRFDERERSGLSILDEAGPTLHRRKYWRCRTTSDAGMSRDIRKSIPVVVVARSDLLRDFSFRHGWYLW